MRTTTTTNNKVVANKVGFTKAELVKMADEGKICGIYSKKSDAIDYITTCVDVEKIVDYTNGVCAYEGTTIAGRIVMLLSCIATNDNFTMYEVLLLYVTQDFYNTLYNPYYDVTDEDNIKDVEEFLYAKGPVTFDNNDYYMTAADTIITDSEANRGIEIAEAVINRDENEPIFEYDLEEDTVLYDAHNGNSSSIDEEKALILTYLLQHDMTDEAEYTELCNNGYDIVTQAITRTWHDEEDYTQSFTLVTACSKAMADIVRKYYYHD